MYGLTRGLSTLLGAGLAGFLIWVATTIDSDSTGGFWAAMAIIAAAGLVLGLSQILSGWSRRAGSRVSGSIATLLLGFVPAFIVVAWVLLATQPAGGWQQGRLASWSDDIGIGGVVQDLGLYVPVLAFGLGAVLSFCLDTGRPVERIVSRPSLVPEEDVHDYERRDVVTRDMGEPVTTIPMRDRTEVQDPTLGNLPPERRP